MVSACIAIGELTTVVSVSHCVSKYKRPGCAEADNRKGDDEPSPPHALILRHFIRNRARLEAT